MLNFCLHLFECFFGTNNCNAFLSCKFNLPQMLLLIKIKFFLNIPMGKLYVLLFKLQKCTLNIEKVSVIGVEWIVG